MKNAKGVRGVLGTLSAVAFGGLSAAGYEHGVPTSAGIDAGLIRDVASAGLALAGVFFPQVAAASGIVKTIGRSLTNDKRVEQLEQTADQRIAELERRVAKLETTRKRRSRRT